MYNKEALLARQLKHLQSVVKSFAQHMLLNALPVVVWMS
jgi:hypothetical protein